MSNKTSNKKPEAREVQVSTVEGTLKAFDFITSSFTPKGYTRIQNPPHASTVSGIAKATREFIEVNGESLQRALDELEGRR